jgi:S-adenosylmethionine synthetase
MDLSVGMLPLSVRELEVEVAEHKGPGHPDTLCDALAEELSLACAATIWSASGRSPTTTSTRPCSGGEPRARCSAAAR